MIADLKSTGTFCPPCTAKTTLTGKVSPVAGGVQSVPSKAVRSGAFGPLPARLYRSALEHDKLCINRANNTKEPRMSGAMLLKFRAITDRREDRCVHRM